MRPTVFAQVRNDDAIAQANESAYGLQAYVFSPDAARSRSVVQQLQAGTVLINRTVTDPLAPFGSLKLSGLGRENGIFGLESFLEPQAIIAG